MKYKLQLESISDDELLRRLSDLLQQSRGVEAELVAHIEEVDERRLFAGQGSPSMFAYCTEVLHLSEAEAYLRITAARASRKHPVLLEMLDDGRLHLSGITKLAPHLTLANREILLTRAAYQSKRKIDELIAELYPKHDVPPMMRKLPERRRKVETQPDAELCPDRVATPVVPGPVKPAAVEPLALARFKVTFTANAELRDKLERLQAIMRSSVPDGDLATIIEDAVTEKLERLESRRFAKTKAPRKSLEETNTSPLSRHIPAAVKRAVFERDGGQCSFVNDRGRRCSGRSWLEFHHRQPFGRKGDHSPANVALMCTAHNAHLAERDYGREVMERYKEPTLGGSSVFR